MANFEIESSWFERERSNLFEKYPNQFALIRGDELIATFPTFQDAYQAGIDKFKEESFFIKQILKEDIVQKIPALFLGLTSAHI